MKSENPFFLDMITILFKDLYLDQMSPIVQFPLHPSHLFTALKGSLQQKQMKRQKPQLQRMRELTKNPEFTSKTLAKKNMNLPKRGLSLQKSAHQRTRKLQTSILLSEPIGSSISEEDIRSSTLFRMMEEELRMMTNKHEAEMARLRQIQEVRRRQLKGVQEQEYSTKMQIWELKNEALSLKQAIQEEKEEIDRLERDLGMVQLQEQVAN